MDRVRRVARSASLRWALREALSLLGPALTAGFVAAGLLVAADRLLALGLSVWAVTAAPVAIAAGAALAAAASRRPGDAGAAARVDHALGLRDRLSSAIELQDDEAMRGDAFAQWAVEDAERAAARADVGKAIPLKLDGWWAVWPAVGAVVVAAAVMAPTVDLLGRGAARTKSAVEASQREAAATQIADAADRARETLQPAERDAAPGATSEQMKALEELEEQLATGQLGPDEARSRAAASLEQIAAGADEQAAQMERDLEAIGQRMERLDPSEQTAPLGQELAEALRNGEFDKAAALMEELQRSSGEGAMDPAEREALAADLEKLAQQLESAGEGAALEQQPSVPASEQAPNEQAVEDLQDQGLGREDAERLSEMADENALRQALQDEGVSPEVADRLAEEIARKNRERKAQEKAQEQSEELSDALRDAADDVREPAPPPPPPPAQDRQPSQDNAAEEQDRGSDAPNEREPNGQPGEQQRERPGEQSGERQGERPEAAPQEERGAEQRREGQQEQPGGEQPNAPEGAETGGQKDSAEGEKSTPPEAGEAQGGPEGGVSEEQAPPGEGGQRPTGDEQRSAPAQPPQGGTPPPGAERARRAMEQMQRQREEAEGRRGDAESLRREAQRLMEEASPEQREQAERWAKHRGEESSEGEAGGGSSDGGTGVRTGPTMGAAERGTEIVDARRGSSEQGRVAAEWVDPNAPAPQGSGVEGPRSAERVREAAKSAERAMEEQSVSPRYSRVVREFFRRRLEAAENKPLPAPEPAQDVERKP